MKKFISSLVIVSMLAPNFAFATREGQHQATDGEVVPPAVLPNNNPTQAVKPGHTVQQPLDQSSEEILFKINQEFNTFAIAAFEWAKGKPVHQLQPAARIYNKMFDVHSGIKFDEFPEGTAELFKEVIPQYVKAQFAKKMRPDQLYKFYGEFSEHLKRTKLSTDPAHPNMEVDKTEAELKEGQKKALSMIVHQFDPFMLKLMQALKSKARHNALSEVITETQTSLPAQAEKLTMEAIQRDYGEEGAKRFKFKNIKKKKIINGQEVIVETSVLGTGTVGQANLMTYTDEHGKEHEIVVKVIKQGAKEGIESDARTLTSILNATKAKLEKDGTPESEKIARGIPNIAAFIEKHKNSILSETDVTEEIRNVAEFQKVYKDEKGTIKVVPVELADIPKAKHTQHVILLKKAEGIELSKRLEELKKKGKANLTKEELQEEKDLREAMTKFIYLQNTNILNNELVHTDPHAGNFMWDKATKTLRVLDAGAATKPSRNKVEHEQGLSFVLHMFISMATRDANHLTYFFNGRMVEEKQNPQTGLMEKKPIVQKEHVEALTKELQKVFDEHPSLPVGALRKDVIKVLAKFARDVDPKIFPDSLGSIARASTLLGDLYSTFADDLEGTEFARNLHLLKRTDAGVALHAMMDYDLLKLMPWGSRSLWTPESRKRLLTDLVLKPGQISRDLVGFLADVVDLTDEDLAKMKAAGLLTAGAGLGMMALKAKRKAQAYNPDPATQTATQAAETATQSEASPSESPAEAYTWADAEVLKAAIIKALEKGILTAEDVKAFARDDFEVRLVSSEAHNQGKKAKKVSKDDLEIGLVSTEAQDQSLASSAAETQGSVDGAEASGIDTNTSESTQTLEQQQNPTGQEVAAALSSGTSDCPRTQAVLSEQAVPLITAANASPTFVLGGKILRPSPNTRKGYFGLSRILSALVQGGAVKMPNSNRRNTNPRNVSTSDRPAPSPLAPHQSKPIVDMHQLSNPAQGLITLNRPYTSKYGYSLATNGAFRSLPPHRYDAKPQQYFAGNKAAVRTQTGQGQIARPRVNLNPKPIARSIPRISIGGGTKAKILTGVAGAFTALAGQQIYTHTGSKASPQKVLRRIDSPPKPSHQHEMTVFDMGLP